MVAHLDAAAACCEVSPAEAKLLTSPRRPIVHCGRRSTPQVAEELAPKNPYLGVMLPSTPLHHLLMKAMAGTALVMTSGNRADEPIVYEDEKSRSPGPSPTCPWHTTDPSTCAAMTR